MASCPGKPFRTLVINTVGEPGCGKTTLSFWLCQALKSAGVVVEFVPEVIKYECFSAEGRRRVSSGLVDRRYMRLQARLFHAVAGEVEVLVNDGAFELGCFYGKRRMTPDDYAKLEAMAEQYILAGPEDVLFVAPVRAHDYETQGRIESEEESRKLRSEMLGFISERFRAPVLTIENEVDREGLLGGIIARVMACRGSTLAPEN